MTAEGTHFEIRELANGWIELFESSIALHQPEPDVSMAPHKFRELVEVGWFTIYVINPPTNRWGIEWEIEYNAWKPPLAERRR